MTRGRILHCIPSMSGGGAERQLAYLAGELAGLGWDVHVALVSGGPNVERLRAGGATLHRIAAASNYDPRILWRLVDVVDRAKPDLVQVWLLQMEILGAAAAGYRGVPWILSERCSEPAYPRTLKHRLRDRVARHASAVVANSSGGRQYWDARLPATVARYVIPNALPLEEMRAAAPADESETGVPAGDELLLFAGRLTAQKNPETLMKAMARVLDRSGRTAVIAGDGPLREKLRGLAREYGIENRVRFPGYLNNLWGWMKRANLFVSPSLFEGHPNTVLEAAACGCPLVVSDIPAHREFLDRDSAVLVPPQDAEALASALEDVLERAGHARSRAEHAAETVARWSTGRIAREYQQVYEDVLDRARGDRRASAGVAV